MGTSTATIKHFDYLVEHDSELEAALGLNDLSNRVNRWRRNGMEDPEGALVGCRKTVEAALETLAAPLPDDRMRLYEIIDYAEEKGTIDWITAKKCREIRRLGNKGAHELSVKEVDAKMALDLLDDFLRWCAENKKIISAHSGNALPNDPIFIVRDDDEVAEMSKKARLAAALDDNKEIEKKAKKVKGQIEAFDDSSASDLQKMQELIKQAEAIGASAAARKDEKTLEVQETLFNDIESTVETIKAEKKALASSFDDVNTQIDEILSEHDFVKKLLHGGNQATVEQHAVMAFPRGSNSVTNVLQISGGAGTGKTLCLLAKLISEVDDHGQGNLLGETKNALFICYNKGLALYVKDILNGCEGTARNLSIEVVNYDSYINQLVRSKPKKGYEHLAEFAGDVRYPVSRKITYASDELLKEAQATVAGKYPARAKEYYLDSSNEDEFTWLKDELRWIEARFATAQEAAKEYPTAERVGRGAKHRPGKAIREIILEVWREFDRLLEANGKYTIEQATKRLMDSVNLPAYDAIAIDEVQDFSLLSVKLVLRFRRDERSKVFLSGDENQKIYQRDFTWKELDEGLKGHTITLRKNMRNSSAIRCFSDRLLGEDRPYEKSSQMVHVVNADEERTVTLLRKLSELPQTTALITGKKWLWDSKLRAAGVPVLQAADGEIRHPGLYLIPNLAGKGLEFDNVVVDYDREDSEDGEAEKRLRYVHFTRARKRLYVRYQGTPPRLLSKYYADFLG